jgi:hypothetical protein
MSLGGIWIAKSARGHAGTKGRESLWGVKSLGPRNARKDTKSAKGEGAEGRPPGFGGLDMPCGSARDGVAAALCGWPACGRVLDA